MSHGSEPGLLSSQTAQEPPSPWGRGHSEKRPSLDGSMWGAHPRYSLCNLHGISFPFPSPRQSSYPIWEDFNSKATKLHSQLR